MTSKRIKILRRIKNQRKTETTDLRMIILLTQYLMVMMKLMMMQLHIQNPIALGILLFSKNGKFLDGTISNLI